MEIVTQRDFFEDDDSGNSLSDRISCCQSERLCNFAANSLEVEVYFHKGFRSIRSQKGESTQLDINQC